MSNHNNSRFTEKNNSAVCRPITATYLPSKDQNENVVIDVTEMIRSLQRVEGNIDCFRKGFYKCTEKKCRWRNHCF